MINVKQAQRRVLENAHRLPARDIALLQACGRVLAEDIRSPLALPLWDNSAMDGYVLKAEDTRKASAANPVELKIKEVIKAGDTQRRTLKRGETMRIMTGAVIPAGGNAVVAQEDVTAAGSILRIKSEIRIWNHIRRKGEDVRRGAVFHLKDTVVSPGTVAFLSSLGRNKVKVYGKPEVSVVVTGSELVKAGNKLKAGQIYESNSAMLVTALRQSGIEPVFARTVKDNRKRITTVLKQALKASDTVILAGGVSVGDYDYSKEILADLGVKTVFWKVAQKPGKPIYMGRLNRKLVFGLPGNPASAFICFYEYVLPGLLKQMGHTQPFLNRHDVKAQTSIKRNPSKTIFLKARCTQGKESETITLLPHQGSHMVSSLHDTNALAVIEPGPRPILKGQKLLIDRLPPAAGKESR